MTVQINKNYQSLDALVQTIRTGAAVFLLTQLFSGRQTGQLARMQLFQ